MSFVNLSAINGKINEKGEIEIFVSGITDKKIMVANEFIISYDNDNFKLQTNENKRLLNYKPQDEIEYKRVLKSRTKSDIINLLSFSDRNSQELIDNVIIYVMKTPKNELEIFHISEEEYNDASARFAAITYSFITSKENEELFKLDPEYVNKMNEFADKCITAMGFSRSTEKYKKLEPASYYKGEVYTRHLGIETFLGKKKGNNEYDKNDLDHWKLASGDFFIQSNYTTKKTKNSNPERFVSIPEYYGNRSGMYKDNFKRFEKFIEEN